MKTIKEMKAGDVFYTCSCVVPNVMEVHSRVVPLQGKRMFLTVTEHEAIKVLSNKIITKDLHGNDFQPVFLSWQSIAETEYEAIQFWQETMIRHIQETVSSTLEQIGANDEH